jgi:hypothetical protein
MSASSRHVIRDYVATLIIAVKKGFFEPLDLEKIPKSYVLEADSSNRRHDSTSLPDKIWNYAAIWATAVKNGFVGLLAQEKYPKVSALEAKSYRRRHDSTSFPDRILFP